MRRALMTVLVLLGIVFVCRASAFAAPLQCAISTVALDLGSYDVFALNDTTAALSNAVQYTCNKNSVSVEITLGPSSGPSTYAPRSMSGPGGGGNFGSDTLAYYLSLGGFTPSCGGGGGIEWGDSSLSNGTASYFGVGAGKGLPNPITVYACMPHGQNADSTVHTDNLLMTISY